MLTVVLVNRISAQSRYTLGISLGAGVNIFRNHNSTDTDHFKFRYPISGNLGIKLIRQLDEKNNFFLELIYTRKKIEFKYDRNESEIPFNNQEITGQKYDCISLYFGYRRVIEKYTHALFFDASFGADYNNNVIVTSKGYDEATDEILYPVSFDGLVNTHLGEKTYTISANAGFGIMFGTRNQYEIGAFVNIPLHKIQTETSQLYYRWDYNNKDYTHQLTYIGKIYYPSLKLTYYIF
jgi:hypothetical protein